MAPTYDVKHVHRRRCALYQVEIHCYQSRQLSVACREWAPIGGKLAQALPDPCDELPHGTGALMCANCKHLHAGPDSHSIEYYLCSC